MKTNQRVVTAPVSTHEGGRAKKIYVLQELRRTLLSCFLWEDTFYENGVSVADRMKDLVAKAVKAGHAKYVEAMAIEARTVHHLRHAPLLLARELARHGQLRASTLVGIIQRADELAEFLSIYWLDKKQPLSRQVKLGLGWAFRKFDAYQLAKYNRDEAIKLRDVLFLTHAKPRDLEQEKLWKKLVDGTLEAPDTWEVALSAGADKKTTFERLLAEGRLGYMALLRNLRNMQQAGIDGRTIRPHLIEGAKKSKALPFRFVAAANAVPTWEHMLDDAMQEAMTAMEQLPGKTVVLVDISGSMLQPLSAKSDLNRLTAAAALGALIAGISEDYEVYTFNTSVYSVPSRKGMGLIAAIQNAAGGGTRLGNAIEYINQRTKYDRLIVITDEQSADNVTSNPKGLGYMINVATYQHGVGYGKWVHIDGFSEAVIKFIQAYENELSE